MPGYKVHLVGGMVVYLALLYGISYVAAPSLITSLEWMLCAMAGALFPDVDVKSKGQNIFYWIIFIGLLLLMAQHKWQAASLISLFSLIPQLVGHRGLFHRGLFLIACAVLVIFFMMIWYPFYARGVAFDILFFTLGALSHLWLDMGWKALVR